MKWIVVLFVLGLSIGAGVVARGKPGMRAVLATLLGFLPFVPMQINPISFETYRGDARGIEFTLVDFVAVALAVSVAGSGAKRPWPVLTTAYLGAAIISVFAAPLPGFAFFGVWKLLRIHRVLATVASAGQHALSLAPDVCRGLALGIVVSAFWALVQRYAWGMMQCSGPFSHQNGLGMAVNMIFPVCLALELSGRGGALTKAALAAGALCIVLTLSRGGMALFALAGLVVFGASVAKKVSGRKLLVAMAGLAGAAAVMVKSYDTIVERFTKAPAASEEARELFEHAASAMVRDHAAGIGINQFSYVLDLSYADAVGLPSVDRNGIVHNVYWLTTAEMGYLGIFCFILLFTAPILYGVRTALRNKGPIGDVSLGLSVGMAVTLMQGKLEWSLRTTQLSYLYWILAGLVFALGARESRRTELSPS